MYHLPIILQKIINEYATQFPMLFRNYDERLFGFFPNSLHIEPIELKLTKPTSYFHSYDRTSGKITYLANNEFFYHDLIIKDDQKLIVKQTNKYVCNKIKIPLNSNGEEIIDCEFLNESFIALVFGWGWLEPVTYYVLNDNYQPLKWSYPSETTSYVDGWVTQLYYNNNQFF